MNRLFILVILSSFSLNIFSQSIIQSANVFPGIVSLGNTAQIQVNLEQITLCDTQVPTIDVNNVSKQITLNISYNYVSSCNPSVQIIPVNESFKPLLEGTYFVNINLTVIGDATRNEIRSAGTVTVNNPNFPTCSPIPFESGCPQISNPVCGEDGQNYINECIAFFENSSANYQYETCDNHITTQPLICNQPYTNTSNSFFSEYSCIPNKCLASNEFFLLYQHDSTGLFELNYEKSVSTEIMLATMTNNTINCIAVGGANALTYDNLPAGNYMIIADGTNFTSVVFCPVSSIEKIEDASIRISPNPATDQLKIEGSTFQNFEYKITNLAGQILQKGKTSTNQTIDIPALLKGQYFLSLKSDKQQLIRKFIVR